MINETMSDPIQIPSALVLGCNTPHGINVLSDYIEEQTGHPPDFHQSGWDNNHIDDYRLGDGCGYGSDYGFSSGYMYGYGYGGADGSGMGVGLGFNTGDGCGYGLRHGDGYGIGDGNGFGYGVIKS